MRDLLKYVNLYSSDSKTSIMKQRQPTKQITIRWPEDFWEHVAIEATKRRTSVQAIVTESVAKNLGMPIPNKQQG